MIEASKDIVDMLEASGLGLVYKKNIFRAKEPTSPPIVVTVYDTPSFEPERTLDNNQWYYRSSVQVRIRHTGYTLGMALAWNILESLHSQANTVWNGTLYTVIQAVGEPASIAWDENNRVIIVINFNLQRR